MNCQSCNARIDYRFLTKCAHCDCDIEQASVSRIDPVSDLRGAEPVERRFTWKHGVINLAYIFFSSIAGMISGAVVLYLVGGFVYLALFTHASTDGEECARGTAFAMLSIFLGAFVGMVGGTVLAVMKLPCKGVVK